MDDYKNKDLFQQDAVDKQLSISYDGGVIANSDLYSGEFELRESLCSGSELKFGACEASTLKIKVANVMGSLKNKELTVTEVLNGDKEAPFSYGKYKVYSDVPSGDRTYRTITAYDAMYDIINMDVAAWYNSIKFPLSLKKMRDSFFNYMGITQVETSLVNDAMTIEETINSTTISGKTIISAICELNGVFGHINRDGEFEYVRLTQKAAGLYPAVDLYPSKQLYPMEDKSETIKKSNYIDVEYEDYKTQPITKLQIRDKEGDIGAVVGSGSNCYIVQSNILTYGKSAEELATVAKNLYDVVKDITYRPFKATMKGLPYIEVGKAIRINSKRQVIESYVLTRTLKGIQALRDSMQASGVYEYAEKVNSINEQINQLRGKTNTLVRNVEETQSTLEDVANGLQSQIEQTAEAIKSKVTKGDISSEISQEAGDIEIKANRITIQSDKFTLNKDGSITCTDAKIVGGDIELISTDTNPRFKIYDSEENEAIILQSPTCFFKHKSGRGISISLALGTISCYSNGLGSPPTAIIGAANSFQDGINVSGTGRFNNDATIQETLTVKEDITIQDEWYNGWTITDCLKDLYEKVNVLSS